MDDRCRPATVAGTVSGVRRLVGLTALTSAAEASRSRPILHRSRSPSSHLTEDRCGGATWAPRRRPAGSQATDPAVTAMSQMHALWAILDESGHLRVGAGPRFRRSPRTRSGDQRGELSWRGPATDLPCREPDRLHHSRGRCCFAHVPRGSQNAHIPGHCRGCFSQARVSGPHAGRELTMRYDRT